LASVVAASAGVPVVGCVRASLVAALLTADHHGHFAWHESEAFYIVSVFSVA
jgi:hypothetical protein